MQLKKNFNMSSTLKNLLPICCQFVVSYHQAIDNIFLNGNIIKHPQLINIYDHWPESLLSSLNNNNNNIKSWLPFYRLGKARIGLGFDKNVMQYMINSGCLKLDVHSCFSLSTHFLSRVNGACSK